MKKLVKFLLVLGMVFVSITVSQNRLFAQEEDPQTVKKQEEIIAPNPEPSGEVEPGNKPEVIVVDKEEVEITKTDESDETIETEHINHDGLEEKDIEIIEVITDKENPDLPGETTVTTEEVEDQNKEKIDEHIFIPDELVVNPSDIKIEIDPKFTEEVSGVSAIAVDDETLRQRVIGALDVLNISGLKDKDVIKLKVNDKDENKGTWVIETPEISYEIKKERNKYGFVVGYYIEVENGNNDYDKVYINIFTEDMKIDEGVRDDETGGLDIPDIEISVPENGEWSEEVVIFNPEKIDMFVTGYEDTYDDNPEDVYKKETKYWMMIPHTELVNIGNEDGKASEGLSIENIKIVNNNPASEDERGLTATVNNDGSVSVKANAPGEYDVYLEGWYTQKRYVPVAGIKNYVFDDLPAGTYYREINGDMYKIAYTPATSRKAATTVWYKLEENSGWATFADIKVNAVLASADIPIYINDYDGSDDVDGKREWLVIKETEELQEPDPQDPDYEQKIKEYETIYEIKTEIENLLGEKSEETFFFDIDLYEQMYVNGVAQGKAEKIGDVGGNGGEEKTLVSLTVTLTKEIAEGKKLEFTVLFKHGDNDVVTIKPEEAIDNGDGTWTIKFKSGLFSTYAITYEVVDIPQPEQPTPKKHSNGFRVVHTGVDAPVKETTTNNTYFSLIAVCGLVVLIALKKRKAVR